MEVADYSDKNQQDVAHSSSSARQRSISLRWEAGSFEGFSVGALYERPLFVEIIGKRAVIDRPYRKTVLCP
jgi:hypothetical protein